MQAEQLLLALAALDRDMDVVVAGRIVGTGATTPARQVRPLDSDQHDAIIARGLLPFEHCRLVA
jgi:hypothetical protein